MTMTANQGALWKQIIQAYAQWDPDGGGLMPVSELASRLPAVTPEQIGETLAQAASEQTAEVGSIGEDPGFRPLISPATG